MPSPPLSIIQPLSPRVAILSSDDVKLSCEANGCRGLEELLRPWEGGTERVSVLSSTLTPTIHPSFPLRFISFESIFPNPGVGAPMPDMVVDMIGSHVGTRRPDEEQHYALARSLLLSTRPVAAHETFNHPVGVLFAVSTAEADPLLSMRRLVQQHTGAAQTVPWMDAVPVMKFFLVVHDVARQGQDTVSAKELLAGVKKAYGPHCTLLILNSRSESRSPPPSPDVRTHPSNPLARPLTPDEVHSAPSAISQIYASALSSLTLSPMSAAAEAMGEEPINNTPASPSRPVRRKLYGSKLSAEDTQRLVALVRELVVQSLLPWMEARVREWNEVYHANRRGITGRLFGAGRKFFGSRPASPAPNVSATGYNTAKGYYPTVAVESLTRRLADFAFMLRDYRFASGIYDSLRRDFAQDRALRHAAAATEMYGLSLLLSNSYFLPSTAPRQLSASPFTTLQHTDISSWLEQSVMAYYEAGQGIQLDALRATVLYYEAWKMVGEWRGVGAALVRAAGEAEEVVGAVMIEEAAQADLRGGRDPNGRGKRRRAFHLVIAGRRYETAGLKSYSRRCLTRAAEIYRSTPWTAIKDRIEYSLGRQAYASGEMAGAVGHFLTLLGRDDTDEPGSQGGPLQDMGLAYEVSSVRQSGWDELTIQQLITYPDQLENVKGTLELPDPIFNVKRTEIITAAGAASGSRRGVYAELEAKALGEWDRKGKKPMRLLQDQSRAEVSGGDTFHVELLATNPLNTPLILSDLTVTFSSTTVDVNEIHIEPIPEIQLDAYEARPIRISVTMPTSGSLTLDSATFLFHRFLPCTQSLQKRGRRLHATKAQRLTPTYGSDTTLSVEVVQGGPRLTVELVWESTSQTRLVGEEVEVGLRISNDGHVAVEDLAVILSEPGSLRLRESGELRSRQNEAEDDAADANADPSTSNHLDQSHTLNLGLSNLDPGSEKLVPMIFTPRSTGAISIDALVIGHSRGDLDQVACAPVSATVEAREAVEVSAQIRLSGEAGGYVILVEAQNRSKTSIQLDNLHFASPYWTASSIDLGPAALLPNQGYRTVLPIQPPEFTPPHLDLRQTSLVDALSLLVQGKPAMDDQISHPSLDFLQKQQSSSFDSSSYLASRQAYRSEALKTSFPTLSTSQLAVFPLVDPLDLDLILSWSISSDTSPPRAGHTYVHALRPAPAFSVVNPIHQQVAQALASGSKAKRTMYEETGRLRRVLVDSVLDGVLAREEDSVQIRMRVKGAVKGVVKLEQEMGMVGVEVEVRNRSPAVPARWVLQLPADSAESAHQGQAVFAGSLIHMGTLQPNSTEIIPCQIMAPEPGRVELGGWNLDVETGDVEGSGEGERWSPRMSWSRVGSGGTISVL